MSETELRDRFAIAAMESLSAIIWADRDIYDTEKDVMVQLAKSAYEMADVMLQQREFNKSEQN